MAMILDAFMSKFSALLADLVYEEVIMQLGVKDELHKLRQRMRSIQCLLKDAEKKKFDESAIELWFAELKDVMYDAEDIIDLCRIEGTQLLTDQNPKSKTSLVCCDFSSAFSCFTSVPLRHDIGNRIKDINGRLNQIYEDRKHYKLEKSTISKTPQINLLDSRQTSSMVDPFIVGREVEVAANSLVDHLLGDMVDEKCRLFAITGMGGVGKTTLAQKVFNHPKIQTYFNVTVWVCVSQTYLETELLKQVIRGAKGNYGDSNTKEELQRILRDSVTSIQSLFLVLDDVWESDVWINLFRVPFYNSNRSVRVLITTRDENIVNKMQIAYIHSVTYLSEESSWDMLRRRLFLEEQEELANGLRELGLMLVNKCKGLPLAIKVIAGVLLSKPRNKKAWKNFLNDNAWFIYNLPGELSGALYLSFEDLPSHLKQCFLYFSLYREDAQLDPHEFAQLWVAEGFITKQQDSLMEDLAEECFNELLNRNLLLPKDYDGKCRMHDLIRSLTIFLSKEETSFGDLNVRNSTRSIKLRRISVANQEAAVEILDCIADQGALRTLLASSSDLLLDDERLRRLSHLRVLDISHTQIQILPDSIGKLVHLRYLNLNHTHITTIPKSIEQLTNLQFLDISFCKKLGQLPSGITQLHNLRRLDIFQSPVCFHKIMHSASVIRIAFPKLERLQILNFPELEEWSFGTEVEQNTSPRLKLLPCLQKLIIRNCPLFKQLPEGLKYSSMKSLEIVGARRLKSVDNLSAKIEELHLSYCEKLKVVCCAPTLKTLEVQECKALSCVKKLDSLQKLSFNDFEEESLPEWLLKFLQQRGLQNDSNDDFLLDLYCSDEVIQKCIKGGSYWDLIQHIPRVKMFSVSELVNALV
ncbi:putative disease resistance protein RGA1 [Dendrobium catenatum]|uniref:putative disease resistance protein RGA1 n=1 Tax=Dendrobium catenatum TaxID=906689 RepID=UPI00109F3DAC|nr:putative disease resistance protein RGA1 [Dendrobium catenatum]